MSQPDLPWADFQVALSFPEERRDLVEQVHTRLGEALGAERVFYYRRFLPGLALPNLDLVLQHIYHDRSSLVVVFLDQHYGTKRWCGIEWRAIRGLLHGDPWNRVMLIALTERFDELGLYSTDGCFDARGLSPEAIASAILERLRMSATPGTAFPPPLREELTPAGVLRLWLDGAIPGLHRMLTRLQWLPEPAERRRIDDGLAQLATKLRHEVWRKNYLPLQARTVDPEETEGDISDPFAQLVHLNIREVLGLDQGGDSASAQIAAVNRRSRIVKKIEKNLRQSRDPLVLLGDPGSGKTMTLQKTALSIVYSERRRVFPRVVLYVRLGEFHLESRPPGIDDVRRLVDKACPPHVRPWLKALEEEGRLVVLFDGMDEMSRDGYTEHTAALSRYAMMLEEKGGKSLFTCRITDFSPELRHGRLVLLPFHKGQIARYLRLFFRTDTIVIDDHPWPIPKLAHRLAERQLSVDARNPFVLSLLCGFLRNRKTWPASRTELLEHFFEDTYTRKGKEAEEAGAPLTPFEEARTAWSRFAWIITESNRGTGVPIELLFAGEAPERVREMIRAGTWCGVLTESIEQAQHLIRFEHHRFQEYFAARFIHDNRPAIEWLPKLDAPRWQETMLNLVLLGGAEQGVDALAASIASEVETMREAFLRREAWQAEQEVKKKADKPVTKEAETEAGENKGEGQEKEETEALDKPEATEEPAEPEEPPLPDYSAEALLADRVELGARLIPQGTKVSTAVGERLRPRLHEAVALLIERGTPITQVKMMRACQDLDDVDFLDALEKPLRSSVGWVRNQAVILVAARPGRRSDLVNEMGMDLATYSFLPRWLVFFRGARANGEARSWLALLFATILGFAHAGFLLAGALGLACAFLPVLRYFAEDLQPASLYSLRLFHLLLLQGTVTAPALVYALARHSAKTWFWMLGSAASALPLAGLALGLWQGDWDSCFLTCSSLLLFLFTPVIALGSSLVHMLILAAYSLVVWPMRRSGFAPSSFFRVAWHDCGYAENAKRIRAFILFSPVALLGGAVVLLLYALLGGLIAIVSATETWVYLLLIGVLAYLVFSLLKGPESSPLPWRPLLGLLRGLKHLAFAAAFLALWAGATFLVVLVMILVSDALDWGIERIPGVDLFPIIPKAVVIVAVCLAFFLLAREFVWVIRNLLSTARRPFAARSISPEAWKTRMEASRPRQQQNLLLRTTHQALGLDAESFLALLEETKASIKEEPALSTYWERRDRLEQALRQERRG